MPRNERLRQQRIQHNWRQQDVADELGIALVTMQRWERGYQQPSAYYRVKLCALFGLSAQELGLVEEPPLPPQSNTAAAVQPDVVPFEELTLWMVPYARNPHFTGRDDLLDQLMQQLLPQEPGQLAIIRRTALTQSQIIKGLGGIGKTQIAVEYAYRAREQGRYTHTLWINAASEEAIMTSFVALADLLPAFSSQGQTDQRKLVAAIIRWLEQCPQPWLLIVDNADDLSLIQPHLPRRGNGCILLTTRASAVGSLASSVEVKAMNVMEGTQLLLRRAQRVVDASPKEIDEASTIVVALAQFPLALDQAGAYIEETGCSLRDYLQIYQEHRYALLARRGTQVTGYPESVATTWDLSFQRVEQINPAAAELLHLCALLSPDHIPEELLTEGAPHWPPALQQAMANRFTFNHMLEALLAFSLVKRLAEDHRLSIHRLVQVVQMERMSPQEQRQWAVRLIRAVHVVFPRNPEDPVATWPQCLRYLEQAQVCDVLIQEHQLLLPEAAEVLDRTGIYLRERALYTLAEPLFQRALHIQEQQMKLEHLPVADTLYNLAILYYRQGKYAEAEPLHQRALRIREQQAGPEDPLVAASLNGLAILYQALGKYAEAEPLFKRALHIQEQQLGLEHPETASPLNNLALLYHLQGKYAEAEPLFKRALHIREQQLGPAHLLVAYPLNNLANLYREQGKDAEAEPLYQRALRIREQQLGPEHPETASLLNNLAFLYWEQGKDAEAESLYQQALHIWEQQLGPEHSEGAYPLIGLALLAQEQGRDAEAEPLYQRALHIWEQQLGSEHPSVAYPLHGLANLYQLQGRDTEAEMLYQRALRIREQQLGPEHPETAEVQHDFAGFQQAQGKTLEAAFLYQRALTTREHVFGPHHPLTTDTRERLHALLVVLNRTEEATQEGRQPEPGKEK